MDPNGYATINTPGVYGITFAVSPSSKTNKILVGVDVNGTLIPASKLTLSAATIGLAPATIMLPLSAGDVVSLRLDDESDELQLDDGVLNAYLSLVRIGD